MTAAVHDQGAQVTSWVPAGGEPVLWLSPRAHLETGRAIRGGVPICFPWFGSGRTGDLAPAHGFARTAPWRLVDEATSNGDITLAYRLTDAEAGADAFPHPYHAAYKIVLGEVLELALTVTNIGDEPFEFEEALHAYLAVGDVRDVRVEGLDGVEYVDKVGGGVPRQAGPLRFTEETDRVYRTGGPVRLVDPVLGRTVVVETAGAADVVVWTPWTDKAAAAGDIGAEAWTQFVCLEGANALDDAVGLDPGQSHTLTYRLSVLPEA